MAKQHGGNRKNSGRKPVVIKSVCPKCGSDRWIKEGDYCECTECMTLFKQTVL